MDEEVFLDEWVNIWTESEQKEAYDIQDTVVDLLYWLIGSRYELSHQSAANFTIGPDKEVTK